jgi:hypothetical protein
MPKSMKKRKRKGRKERVMIQGVAKIFRIRTL